jgi:uncharacterized membrane protein required for colicin V production
MNPIDIAVAVLCALFGVFGILRGLVRQVISLGGLVVGHLAGVRYYEAAVSWLNLSFQYSRVVGYAIVFLAVYLLLLLAGSFIEGRIRASKLSFMDRFAGLAVGLAKGALLSVLLVFLVVIFLPKDSEVLRGSKAAPICISAGQMLAEAFPDRFADIFREKIRAAEKKPPGPPPPPKRGI